VEVKQFSEQNMLT